MKTKADFAARGAADFLDVNVRKNGYAIARQAFYSVRDSWQARAYNEAYAAAGKVYWASLETMCAELKAGKPIAECVNLDSIDADIKTGNIDAAREQVTTAKRASLVETMRARSAALRARIETKFGMSAPDIDVNTRAMTYLATALSCCNHPDDVPNSVRAALNTDSTRRRNYGYVLRAAKELSLYLIHEREAITDVRGAFYSCYQIIRMEAKAKP